MKIRRAAFSFIAISLFYLAVLLWLDASNNVFDSLPELVIILPVMASLTLLSFIVRHFRWRWLLRRAGYQLPLMACMMSYIAGFAFTATPGKVGELLRIRYLARYGVPSDVVISAFLYERVFDLIVVLLFSTLLIAQKEMFLFAVLFVSLVITSVVVMALYPRWLTHLVLLAGLDRNGRLCRILRLFRDGIAGTRRWCNGLDSMLSAALGILAWGLVSASFLAMLYVLDITLGVKTALAIYPLSMLVGAASMLPGGVGSTEAAIVAMLHLYDVPVDLAVLAAIGIRVATIWFAIICGIASMLVLEHRMHRSVVS